MAAKVTPVDPITPEMVLKYDAPTKDFLCPLSANTYGIDFLMFEIKDYDTNRSMFRVSKEEDAPPLPTNLDSATEAAVRTIKYTFPADFLHFKTIRTGLTFKVGPEPVPNFRMIERHYFRNRLIRSYDFAFGFCIPNSTNSWESIYQMPELTQQERDDMVAHPFECKSDSFYFVNDELIMHNKAEYAYA